MSPDFVLTFVPIVFLGVGAALIWFGRRNRLLAKASASWPHVAGQVTSLDVAVRRRAKGGTRFVPQMTYAYDVAGQRHTGDRLAFSAAERVTTEAARQALAPYQVGGPVTVYYDPAAPSSATLSTSAAGTVMTEVLGWICVVMAFAVGSFNLMA